MIITIKINNDGESLEKNLWDFFNENSDLEKKIGEEIFSILIDKAREIDQYKDDFKDCSEIVFGITGTEEAKKYFKDNEPPEETKVNRAFFKSQNVYYNAFIIGNNGDGRFLVTVPEKVFYNIKANLTPMKRK